MSIVAAGGIILGSGRFDGQIVLVRRRRYRDEIGLPKGKSRGAESPMETALREAREETGLGVRVREFAGSTHYAVKGTPKTVFYFVMDLEGEDAGAIEDTAEIESIEWAAPAAAIRRLSHREDRTLVAAVFGCNPCT
jgi:8-oxo-dGTP pyrophosphatase MutT (NUDIX family)